MLDIKGEVNDAGKIFNNRMNSESVDENVRCHRKPARAPSYYVLTTLAFYWLEAKTPETAAV